MTRVKRVQVIVVEEVAKGAMADVVYESRHTEKFAMQLGQGTSVATFCRNG